MSQKERFGTRDLSYSAWHREASTGRWLNHAEAHALSMIDLDCVIYVEYDDRRTPLLLIEVAEYTGKDYKTATVTRKLAERARLTAFCVLYTCGRFPNPADRTQRDIACFRVQQIWPRFDSSFREMTPEEYARFLADQRAIAAAGF